MTRYILFFLFSFSGSYNRSDFYFTRQRMVELLFSILIISILVTVAMPTYNDYRKRAKIIHANGEISKETDMYVYYALNGSWPKDKKVLEKFSSDQWTSYSGGYAYDSNYIQSVSIENGAFHVLFREEMEGKTLSIRPAVPEADSTGPIILVSNKEKPGWVLAGSDKTTIDEKLTGQFLNN